MLQHYTLPPFFTGTKSCYICRLSHCGKLYLARNAASYKRPSLSDTVSADCLSAARLVPHRQRPRYAAKLAALRATSPTGLYGNLNVQMSLD